MATAGIESRTTIASCGVFTAEATPKFVVLFTLLVTIVYTMPITQNWTLSLEAHYVDLNRLESRARDGVVTGQIGIASLGAFGLMAAGMRGGRKMRVYGLLGILCVAYLAWCGMSCLWATDLKFSLRRFAAALCEALAGFAVAKRASPLQLTRIMFWCTLSWLGLSLLAELSLGTFRPWQADYRFAGIFHPNSTGGVCALLALSAIYLGRSAPRSRWLLWAIAGVALVFLYLTRSRTALAAVMLAAVLAWLLIGQIRRVAIGLLTLLAAAITRLLIGSTAVILATGAATLGRADSEMGSLTGRVPLWQELIPYAAHRPWRGYGYSSFWTTERIIELSGSEAWAIASSHSLYLDLVLSIGLIGAALCVAAMVLAILRSIRLERQFPKAGYGITAMLLLFVLVSGFSETTFGTSGFLMFFAMCSICFTAFRDNEAAELGLPDKRRPQAGMPALVAHAGSIA